MSVQNPYSEHSQLLPPATDTAVRYDSVEEDEDFTTKSNKWRTKDKVILFLTYLGIVSLLSFVGINIYWVTQRSSELINDSVDMVVHNVSLAGVSTKGIDVRVHGTTLVDYDDIESSYFKNVLKLGGGVLRKAAVNMDSVALETEVDGEKIRVGTVEVPKMNVNIAHGKQTPIDMVVRIHPDTAKLLGLVKKILNNPDDILKVYGSTALKVALGGIPVGTFDIDFEQAINPNDYFELNTQALEIQSVAVLPDEEEFTYDFSLVLDIPNPIKEKMISLEVPMLQWSISVEDCKGELTIPILLNEDTIRSQAFTLSSLNDTLSVNISASVSQLNEDLNEDCQDGSTPMNRLVNGFMSNNTLPVRVQNIGGSKFYPSFINELLTKNYLDFVYHPSGNSSHLIHNSSVTNLGFDFVDGDIGRPVVSGEVHVFLEMPVTGLESGAEAKYARGVPKLYHGQSMFGEVELGEWHTCVNEFVRDDGKELLHVMILLNQEAVNITDSEVFSSVVNEVLLGGGSKIKVKSDLDAVISTLIGEFEIDGIHVETESKISIGSLF